MPDDNEQEEQKDEGATKTENGSGGDGQTAWDEYASDKKCPECGEPVIDVRSNCPKCGYEYKDDDFGDQEAGKEFLAGSAVTDEGEEVPDHESGTGEDTGEQADEEASEDTSDDTSDDTSEGTSDDTSGDED